MHNKDYGHVANVQVFIIVVFAEFHLVKELFSEITNFVDTSRRSRKEASILPEAQYFELFLSPARMVANAAARKGSDRGDLWTMSSDYRHLSYV